MKAIVEYVGIQKLIEISQGGAEIGPAVAIWDERVDGPIPPEAFKNIGGLTRAGNALSFDTTKKALNLIKRQEHEGKQVADKAARKSLVRGAKTANSIVALRALVIAMAEELGYEIDP